MIMQFFTDNVLVLPSPFPPATKSNINRLSYSALLIVLDPTCIQQVNAKKQGRSFKGTATGATTDTFGDLLIE
jgi:hypothetical protein